MPFWRIRILMIFYRQISNMVASGIPLIEAMRIMSSGEGDYRFRGIAAQIKQNLDQGSSISEAFSQFPNIFPALHINVLRYSEKSGRIIEGLNSLADYLEKDYASLSNIMVGLAYPFFILHVAIFLLPVINAVNQGFVAYIMGVLSLLIPFYGLLILLYFLICRQHNERLKTGVDNFLLNIPLIGGIVRQFSLTLFFRAMQVLSASGVSVVTGWKMAADACGSNVIRNALLSGLPLIEQGQSLSQAFIRSGVFAPSMIGMISTAEKSGSIVSTLSHLVTYLERENETQVAILVRIVPVIVFLLVAFFIGVRVVSFYTGYFNRLFTF